MKFKNAIMLIGLGVGGTLAYEKMSKGTLKKATKKITKLKNKMLSDIEDEM